MLRLATLALLAFCVACSRPEPPAELAATLARAERLLREGDIEGAEAAARSVRDSKAEELRTAADLVLARAAAARRRHAVALAEIQELANEIGERPSKEAFAAIDAVVERERGAPLFAALVAQADRAKESATRRAEDRRAIDLGAVNALIASGELSAALQLLHDIEAKREPNDVKDVTELLALVAQRSEADASALLKELSRDDPDGAAKLDASFAKLRGTSGGARVLAARIARYGLPDGKSRDSSQDDREDG